MILNSRQYCIKVNTCAYYQERWTIDRLIHCLIDPLMDQPNGQQPQLITHMHPAQKPINIVSLCEEDKQRLLNQFDLDLTEQDYKPLLGNQVYSLPSMSHYRREVSVVANLPTNQIGKSEQKTAKKVRKNLQSQTKNPIEDKMNVSKGVDTQLDDNPTKINQRDLERKRSAAQSTCLALQSVLVPQHLKPYLQEFAKILLPSMLAHFRKQFLKIYTLLTVSQVCGVNEAIYRLQPEGDNACLSAVLKVILYRLGLCSSEVYQCCFSKQSGVTEPMTPDLPAILIQQSMFHESIPLTTIHLDGLVKRPCFFLAETSLSLQQIKPVIWRQIKCGRANQGDSQMKSVSPKLVEEINALSERQTHLHIRVLISPQRVDSDFESAILEWEIGLYPRFNSPTEILGSLLKNSVLVTALQSAWRGITIRWKIPDDHTDERFVPSEKQSTPTQNHEQKGAMCAQFIKRLIGELQISLRYNVAVLSGQSLLEEATKWMTYHKNDPKWWEQAMESLKSAVTNLPKVNQHT